MSAIEPVDKTITQTIVRFSLDIIELLLNQSATFRVSLYNANDKVIDTKFVTVEGTDYSNWGNDDEYIVQFVASQLEFTRKL
jgi:hypothetical protein